MRVSIFASKLWLVLLLLFSISACSHRLPNKDTITLCDATGCSERPHDYASADPSQNTAEDRSSAKIAALETLARSDPRAAYDLALRFFRGDGVRQDSYLALKWMRDAAERGNFNAQQALGRIYLTGLGELGSDPGEAEKWLTICAGKGDKEAERLLKEAAEVRQSQQAQWQWLNRWRSTFNTYWYSGYRYNSYWRVNRWYWY